MKPLARPSVYLGLALAATCAASFCATARAQLDPRGSNGPVGAAPDAVLERVDTALSRGEIDYSSAARQKLYYLFERGSMDPRWSKGDLRPARCGTLVLEELRTNLDRLDPETRALYERYTLRATGSRLTTRRPWCTRPPTSTSSTRPVARAASRRPTSIRPTASRTTSSGPPLPANTRGRPRSAASAISPRSSAAGQTTST